MRAPWGGAFSANLELAPPGVAFGHHRGAAFGTQQGGIVESDR